jgi:hypothetical protein
MKKVNKTRGKLLNTEFTITIDEKLNHLQGKILAPRKLELANQHLKKMKGLPKI